MQLNILLGAGKMNDPWALTAPALLSTPVGVGSLWLVSSAILTTYSTTAFLKYPDIPRPQYDFALPHRSKIGSVIIEKPTVRTSFTKLKAHSSQIALNPVPTVVDRIVNSVDRATLLTLFRFSGSFMLGVFLRRDITGISRRVTETIQYAPAFAWSAFFLFVANYCNSIALSRVGVPLTYTSKSAIPLITVLFTLILDGSRALPNVYALASLGVIALGITGASWDSPTFEKLGFLAAMISTASQAALNIASKRAMAITKVTGVDAQRCMAVMAFILTVGVSLLRGLFASKSKSPLQSETKSTIQFPPTWLSLFAVAAYHVEYVFAFTFVKLVSPITYGACDGIRRLAIIAAGKQMFGGPKFSTINIFGIVLSLIGALGYTLAM